MKNNQIVHATLVACVLISCSLLPGCGSGSSMQNEAPKLSQIQVTPANKSIAKGTTLQLSATAIYSDGTEKNVSSSVSWQVSPSSVATISGGGNLKGVGKGDAKVSAIFQEVTGDTSVTVGPAVIVSVAVTASNPALPIGESESVTATGKFSDGSTQDVTQSATWQANPSTVAAISRPGNVTGVGKGLVQVSAAYQGANGNTAITVGAAALISIWVTAGEPSLPVGESEGLTATGKFSDGSMQNLTQLVSWQSTPATVATISALGSLTGVGKGIAQVSAAYQGTTGNAAINVGAAALVGITVSASQPTLPLGESEGLTATGKFSDGSTQNLTQLVTWQATPSIVASVNAQGNLTGVGKGVAQISASYQGASGNTAVTVGAAALVSIAVTPNGSSLPAGKTESLSAIGAFSDGTHQNLTQSAAWSSSAPSVAAVSTVGAVAAKSIGSTTISAAVGSVSGNAALSVTVAVIVALNVTPTPTSLLLGKSAQLDAVATFSDGSTQDVTSTATWNSQQPAVVAVNTAGLISAQQAGATTVLASSGGINGSAAVTVTPLMGVSYFDRSYAVTSGIDGTLRLVNPGFTSGEMCAMIYVFDRSQELNECCGCLISDSGLLTLSLINDLTSNPLTGVPPVAGDVEIVPATPAPGNQCNAGSPTPNSLIFGWQTNVQSATAPYQITEIPSTLGPLSASEQQVLSTDCAMLQQLGSGAGICTCGTGD
jgi:trimeric autotransporter adhesin